MAKKTEETPKPTKYTSKKKTTKKATVKNLVTETEPVVTAAEPMISEEEPVVTPAEPTIPEEEPAVNADLEKRKNKKPQDIPRFQSRRR